MKRTSTWLAYGILNSALTLGIAGIGGCADMVTMSASAHDHGMEQFKQQQYTDAAGSFRNATKQNPASYESYYMLGKCYEQNGQYQQAIQAYRTSLDVQRMYFDGKRDVPQKMKTINGLANAIAHSDSRDTETNAVVVKARTSQTGDEYLLLAQVYGIRGDADSAVEAYDHAVKVEPQNFYIAKSYGLYLERLGQATRAEAALRRAYALKTTDEEVNLALRRLGIIPGPSIKPQNALVEPPLPRGPIPQLKLGNNQKPAATPAPAPAPAPTAQPGQTVATPRD